LIYEAIVEDTYLLRRGNNKRSYKKKYILKGGYYENI